MKRSSPPHARRRLGSRKSLCVILAASAVILSVAGAVAVLAADQFFAGDGSALNAPKWGATAAGPFTSAYSAGSVANFAVPNGTGAGASITVGGFNATENFTLMSASGTISNQSDGVVPVSVSAGKTLDFGSQSFTTSKTAGYVKNGAGVLALAGNTYGGGFTLNAGTVIARGINAMGGGAGVLNINGGAIGANSNRDFTDKYSTVKVGGDFQLGVPSSTVPVSSDAANLTFNSPVALGAATRTVTVGAGGTYTLSGLISGGAGAGLTVTKLAGATGRIVLGGANTYTGPTTVSGGTLALTGTGSVANSSSIELAGGSTLDVSGLATALTLADGQALKARGTTSSATVATAAGKGLALAANSPLQFAAFGGGVAPLTVTGAGAVTLSSTNSVAVVVSNGGSPLGAGDYTLISKAAGSGGVTGSAPASLTVGGDGIASGTSASLLISGQQLILRVAPAGSLQFSASAYTVGEGGGSVTVTVTRSGGSAGAVSVSYATGGGTATAVADYAAQSGTLDWASGDSSPKSFGVAITDDNSYEGDETFDVTLGSPAGGATLGTPSSATVTIIENDAAPPTLSVGDISLTEPSSGISYANFAVTLSAASTQTVTVGFTTADGTAVVPGDYAALSGTVTFSPGETSKTVAVAVKADAVSEGAETFSLNLSSPTNATVADGAGVATVTQPVAAGSVLITEFRLRGLGGPNATLFSPEADEFVEVYNNTDQEITVSDAGPSCASQTINTGPPTPCGWALVDSQGSASSVPRFVIPEGTVIPARGHFLAAGKGYSLSSLAAPDLTYDPPSYAGGASDSAGLALFKTADRSQFGAQNVLDAVGFDGADVPFREGTGLRPAAGVTADAEHSFVRNQGSGRPADTNDNRADFTLVAVDPAQIPGGAAALGAPGPENSASPVSRNSGFAVTVPPGVASSVRRTAAVTNGTLGTISLRRRFTNNTGLTLSRLRFRVADLSTSNGRQIFGSQAELRVLDATLEGLTGLKATKLETAPAQAKGGGINSALLVDGALTLSAPLAPGQSVDVEFLLGVMRGGTYQFILVVEGGQ